jgi:multiple sugar transport system substrate-binding protein
MLFGKELLFQVPSSDHFIRYSFFSLFLALLVIIVDLQISDDSSLSFQLFRFGDLGELSDVQVDPFLEAFTYSVAFASTDRINSSNLSNPSIESGDDVGPITLKGLLTDLGDKGRWNSLLDEALEKLQQKHPDKNIVLEYQELPTNDTREEFLRLVSNKSAIDFVSVDQIWLGEFASKGLLSNLTTYVDGWARAPNWYQQHWDGGTYNGTVYGIWTWTDVRGLWYWKDLLQQSQIDVDDLKTWKGYIGSAQKLNQEFEAAGINGTILFDTYYSQDLWFPYLWMLGGDIVQLRDGHPTKGTYWFPTYNSTEGIQALGFIKDQINAGIKPDKLPASDSIGFAQKRIAMIIGGSWIPGYFGDQKRADFENKIGFIPLFPVPSPDKQSSTLMGGWELAIPITSNHKTLAWEFIEAILDPEILGPWIQEYGYLPTQIPLGQGLNLNQSAAELPYYDTLISMIPFGNIRPSIPEYPIIAGHINEAIDRVYYSNATSPSINTILNEAAVKSAHALGW